MSTSRKVISINSFSQPGGTYFEKAQIENSLGDQICPAALLFQDSIPLKAYFECSIVVSGLCCSTLSLLLLVKHYAETAPVLYRATINMTPPQ